MTVAQVNHMFSPEITELPGALWATGCHCNLSAYRRHGTHPADQPPCRNPTAPSCADNPVGQAGLPPSLGHEQSTATGCEQLHGYQRHHWILIWSCSAFF